MDVEPNDCDGSSKECKVETKEASNIVTDGPKELSLLQMLNNVLRTKSEIACKKAGAKAKFVKCKKLSAKKFWKQSKMCKICNENGKDTDCITIDLNVNFNIK